MKKLLCIVAFATFGFVNAQHRDAGQIEVAPYIGYMNSFLNGDEVDNLDSRAAVNFGVKADYYFNDRWSLRSGLSYDAMGASLQGLPDLKLDYIHVPINANWHFGSTRKWNLNFGVSPGFLASADLGGEDIKDDFKSFQLGISYGIGYKLEISDTFSILFDGQGLVGLSNILEDSDDFTRLNAGSSFNVGGVFTF
jgi:hypothetical protein